MYRSIRKNLNPTSLIAMVALFVSLGGISYAAATIGSAEIKNNSIKSVDVKNGGLAAKDLSSKARASLKGQTGPQGPQGAQGAPGQPGADAANVYAVISNPAGAGNASLVRGKGVVSVTESTGVLVRFDRDVSGCVWVANKNEPADTVAGSGFAQVSLSPTGNDILDVRTRDADGAITDAAAHLAVLC